MKKYNNFLKIIDKCTWGIHYFKRKLKSNDFDVEYHIVILQLLSFNIHN